MGQAAHPAPWRPGGPPPEAALPARSRAALEQLRDASIPVTDLHRWLGQSPDALSAWIGFSAPLRTSRQLAPAIREVVVLRVAHALGAARTVSHHEPLARDAGVGDEQLARLAVRGEPFGAELFTSAQLDALTIADLVLADRPLSDAELHADGLSPSEVVHLVVEVAHYVALIALLTSFDLT